MNCPKCLCAKAVKNGIVRSKQRYRCKSCGCNYTQSSLSRTPVD
ncbi:MAG: transposase-like zinc-binding domain-containing protein, partial [Bdellovibrionales bacterium]